MSLSNGKVFVYLLTFQNSKQYVGVSRNPERRLRGHYYKSKGKITTDTPKISRAIAKYGISNITLEVLAEYSSYRGAYARERLEISSRDTLKNGYNSNPGGGKGVYELDTLVGVVFDNLTVIKDSGKRTASQTVLWECVCICGKKVLRSTSALNNVWGYRKGEASCGCKSLSINNTAAVTHGKSRSATYSSWVATKKRCTNPRASDYKDYGGKGITICKSWLDSFKNFYLDMGDKPQGLILCRKDKSLGFNKDNCFWGTRLDVQSTAGNVSYLTCYGETKSLHDWAKDDRVVSIGLNYGSIKARKNNLNWDDNKILTTPKLKNQFSIQEELK